MRWQQKNTKLTIGVALSAAMVPLLLTGCGSTSRTTTVVETWDERPRFFTAEPGEEHSRFANLVWYDRPRFFTRAEDESQSKFSEVWEDRPRVFTERTETYVAPTYTTSYPATTYGTTTYGTTTYGPTYQTVPVESRPGEVIYHDTRPQKPRTSDDQTSTTQPYRQDFGQTTITKKPITGTVTPGYYTAPTSPSRLEQRSTHTTATTLRDRPDLTYGSQTHRNHTDEPQRQTRVQLASDVSVRSIDSQISNWPQESRTVAMEMKSKYGQPDQIDSDRLIWFDADPWAKIVVFKNGSPHAFPTQHMDVLAQSISIDELAAVDLDEFNDFRGNVKVDHTEGLLTSKCRNEAGNFLALNLAHEILTGQKSVVEANNALSEKAGAANRDDRYMKGLLFEADGMLEGDRDLNQNIDRDVDVDVDTDENVDKPD